MQVCHNKPELADYHKVINSMKWRKRAFLIHVSLSALDFLHLFVFTD